MNTDSIVIILVMMSWVFVIAYILLEHYRKPQKKPFDILKP